MVKIVEKMKKEAENIEFPNPSEGFDAIYEVIDGAIKLRMNKPTPEIVEPAREEIKKERQQTLKSAIFPLTTYINKVLL